MIRSLLAGALLCLTTKAARAEDFGTLPNNAILEWPRLFITVDDEQVEPPDPEIFRQHLNLASCICSQNGVAATNIDYELHLTNVTNTNQPGVTLVGSDCQDDIQRAQNCRTLTDVGINDIDTLASQASTISVPLYDLINASPMQAGMACLEANGGNANVWIAVDTDANGVLDFFSPRPIALNLFTDVSGFDTKPPPLPDNIRISGGESSIQIEWDIPTSNATDLFAFQALCMDENGLPVAKADVDDAQFSTTKTVCGLDMPLDLVATPVLGDEGTDVIDPPVAFTSLDPAFICGTQTSGTATSLRIGDLENNKPYTIALIAVDFYGNPTGTFFSKTITPKPVIDLWEDIHDRGGEIEGGFCSTGGDAALPGLLIPLGLAWLIRRRKRMSALAVLGAVAIAPAVVRADDFSPYWEDPSNTSASGAELYEDHVTWRAGIKLGPYTPGIDAQVGVNPVSGLGPYAAMFGNYYTDDNGDGVPEPHDAHIYQFLPMLDVDRVLWSGFGQITVGGSIGYMQKTAFAYRDDSMVTDKFRLRSTSSKNSFHLLPLALTASYRLTQLDDLWGIPVVPYLRGGLAYYIWWMKGPNGNLSKICTDGTDTADCDGNKAYGGTLGFQGSVGVSIRAERIDADAARSMRQTGLYHAGFYAELTAAVVTGFGSDSKLSVGDKTWFAGFDFEF